MSNNPKTQSKSKAKNGEISLTQKKCTVAESWFVGKKDNKNVPSAEQATFLSLVNGEAAFGELYDSIDKAKQSVEITCWGFQPSMYFKRGVDSAKAPVGELLMQKFIQDNVDIKILCWQTSPFATEKFLEDNTPGRSTLLFMHEYLAYEYFLDFILEPDSIYSHFEKLEKEKFLEPKAEMHKMGSIERSKFYRGKRTHSVEQRRFDWAWYDAVEGYNTISSDEEFHKIMRNFQSLHDEIHGLGMGLVGFVLRIKKSVGTGIDELKEFFDTHLLPNWIKELRNEWRNLNFTIREEIHYRLMDYMHTAVQRLYEGQSGGTIKGIISDVSERFDLGSIDDVNDLRITLFNKLFENVKKEIKGSESVHPIDQVKGSVVSHFEELGGLKEGLESIWDLFFNFNLFRNYVNCMNYYFLLRNENKYPNTMAFMRLRNQEDYKNRKQKVSFLPREINPAIFPKDFSFKDEGLSALTKDVLRFTPTHHQKSVMIDYTDPKSAVGFVMGHNMLDRYWDTNRHDALPDDFKTHTTNRSGPGEVVDLEKLGNIDESQIRGRNPSAGAFFGTPRQDISCKLTGKVLYDIDANFVQGWNKAIEDNGYYKNRMDKIEPVERVKREQFKLQNVKKDDKATELLYAQVVRTQPEYKEESILALYNQNLKMVTSYIYFENQYFRFPPFAEALRNSYKDRKNFAERCGINASDMQPLCVFVVTNSSKEGLGPGVVNTDRMLASLGRRDVMPTVARERILEQAGYGNTIQRMFPNLPADSIWRKILPDFILPPPPLKPIKGLNDKEVKDRELAEKVKKTKDPEELRKILKEDLEKEGIKVHICTLVAEDWEEIYIHSKLCLINDTFATLGSANINTRSMQIDSELNVAVESQPASYKIRHETWGWHTNGNEEMNPGKQLIDPSLSGDVFDTWYEELDNNKGAKDKNKKRLMPLLEFDLTNRNRVSTQDLD